jgi:hypothetical protein
VASLPLSTFRNLAAYLNDDARRHNAGVGSTTSTTTIRSTDG